MINLFPWTFKLINQKILFSNNAGDFFFSTNKFLERIINGELTKTDNDFLCRKGFAYQTKNDFHYNSFVYRLKQKKSIENKLSYIIAVPTLRCDLTCDYCQVSRANINASGFDWTDETVQNFKTLISTSINQEVKIEFQGGEPTLRLDIIEEVIEHCDKEGIIAEFVICTNLNVLSDRLLKLVKRKDVFISTSLDGPAYLHTKNRTKNEEITSVSMNNFQEILIKFGQEKINALPTITDNNFETVKEIIDYYIEVGQESIFLRPVNYHGFARKKFADTRLEYESWTTNYQKALEYIFDLNFFQGKRITEFGLEIALKRIFGLGHNSHVDLRSPNPAIRDFLLVDYDGKIFPSDEARMLSRVKQVNLQMGSLNDGIDKEKVKEFNWNHINDVHEDCIHCTYQPFCGIDNIDDISRYNRIDLPKQITFFCNTNMKMFDFIFSKIEQANPIALLNIQGHLTGDFSTKPVMSEWIYD